MIPALLYIRAVIFCFKSSTYKIFFEITDLRLIEYIAQKKTNNYLNQSFSLKEGNSNT